jgi:hypothetical protein
MSWQADADDCRHRLSGHRRDVAQIDGHGLAADEIGSCFRKPETASFQQHVGRDDTWLAVRPVDDGSIVTRPEDDPVRRRCIGTDPANEIQL